MAYEYDRFEREDGGGAFLMGLLAGTVLGAGLGMLFAPKTGSELRNQLSDSANRLQRAGAGAYTTASERVSHFVERGREAYDRARGTGPSRATPPATPDVRRESMATPEARREVLASATPDVRREI
jgi:hypothetical protein